MFKKGYLRKILIISIGVAVILPAYSIFIAHPSFTELLIKNIEDDSIHVATHLARIIPSDLSVFETIPFPDYWTREINTLKKDYRLWKIKLSLPSGRVIYSTHPPDIGRLSKKGYFHESGVKGNSYARLVRKDAKILEGQVVPKDVVETYIPIMRDSKFLVIFEIHHDVSDKKAAIDQTLLDSSIILGLAAFLLLIFLIVIILRTDKAIVSEELTEKKYRVLFDQAADSIVLVDMDSGEIIDFNQKAHESLGYTRKEFRKLKIPDFELIESEANYLKHVKKIFKKGGGVFETKHKRQDGQIRNILVSCKVILIGEKKYIQSIWRDITEKKIAQGKLEKLYVMMRNILEESPLGTYVVNESGGIDYVNPAMLKMGGTNYKQFMSLNAFELESYKAIGLSEKIKSALEGEHFLMEEIDYISYFGNKHSIRNFSGMPLEEKGKKKALIFVEDITKAKKLENDLKRANLDLKKLSELKSEFVSIVSHELRTPLTITREGVSLIIDEVLGDVNEEQKKILNVSRDNVDRLARLINSLLDISKIEAGKIDLRKTSFNIVELANEVSAAFEAKIKEKKIELKTNFSSKKIEIYGDYDKITQILTNLLSNAIRFTEEGSVEIAIKDKEEAVECSVCDTGIGIAKEDLPKVFGKFQQFGRAYGPGEKGTGLGLSIAKKLIEFHEGSIHVESEIGKGTEFSFILPKNLSTIDDVVVDSIRGIKRNHSTFSLLIVSISDFDKIKEELGEEKIDFVLKGIKHVLNTKLSRKDIVLNEDKEFIVILVDCNKEDVLNIKTRIYNFAQTYLEERGISQRIELKFGWASCPEDGDAENDIIKKARNLIHSL